MKTTRAQIIAHTGFRFFTFLVLLTPSEGVHAFSQPNFDLVHTPFIISEDCDLLLDSIVEVGLTTFCEGDEILLTVADTFEEYFWSTSQMGVSSIIISSFGMYCVTVTLDTCIDEMCFAVTLEESPEVEIVVSPEICDPNLVVLQTFGSYSFYIWSTNETTASIIVHEPGLFCVTVTDEEGCFAMDCINLGSLNVPLIHGEVTFCASPPETTILYALEGYNNYLWNTGETSESILVSEPGAYSLTVSDETGKCQVTDSVNVTKTDLPIIVIEDITSCSPFPLTVQLPGFNVIWTNEEMIQVDTAFETGTYYLTYTDQITGCYDQTSANITIIGNAMAEITGTLEFCENQTGYLQVNGGFNSYLWNTGFTGSFFTIDQPGEYCVTVTDFYGCTGDTCVIVEAFDTVQLDSIVIMPDDGSGSGSIDFELSGGTPPFTLNWEPENMGMNLTAGIYILEIIDANDCVSEFEFEVPLASSIDMQDKSPRGLLVVPNPTPGEWEIQQATINNPDEYLLYLFNSSGMLVDHCVFSSHVTRLGSSLPNGVYLLIAETGTGQRTIIKLIKL